MSGPGSEGDADATGRGRARIASSRSGSPRAPYYPVDEELDRQRARIVSSSPLKRLEDQEREQQRKQETARFGLRLTIMGLVVLALFAAMVVRLWSLQVLHSSQYQIAALQYQDRRVPIQPTRGLIIARGGQVLVSNQVLPVVTLSRVSAQQNPAVVGRLAALLGQTTAQVNTALANPQASLYAPVPVAVGVPDSTIVYLSEHQASFPGVAVSYTTLRHYPYGDTAAQLLGYVADIQASQLKQLSKKGYTATDVIGQSGVEGSYESWLRGKPGTQVIRVDALGNPVGTVSETPAVPGDNVVLNVDLGLQRQAENALLAQIRALQSQGLAPSGSGAAVVLDPQNGAVLAMASIPTYNPAWWVGGISNQHWQEISSTANHLPLLNRAIQGLWAPGSTFKLATATAALNNGMMASLGYYINDPGYYKVANCTGQCIFYDNAHEPGMGLINITTALTVSNDVFFYTLGADYWSAYQQNGQYGPAPIQHVAAQYGFGQITGVDLPGEYHGQLDSPHLRAVQHTEAPKAFPNTYYGIGDNINMAFGQGETLVTPLQVATAFATFANGGTRYAPQVVSSIVSPTGRVVKQFAPRVMAHVSLPPSTFDPMMAGFEGVITNYPAGTASGTFQGYPYSLLPLAGKTGTATESTNPNIQPTALFVAFGPTPPAKARYVVAVVIDQAGYGASAAAPVARQIFQYLITHPVGPPDLKAPVGAP